MAAPKCSTEEFIRLFETLGGEHTARRLGIAPRSVFKRREAIEKRLGRVLRAPEGGYRTTRLDPDHPERAVTEVKNGVVLVGSDSHYWPNYITTAHRAFCHFAKEFQPKIVIKNGDVLDLASISRHPPIGWTHQPSVVDEIQTTRDRLLEIEEAAPNADRYWPLGNHDARFETRLAMVAPEFAKVHGTAMKDHFPYWHPCWSVWVNDDVVIKHRFKGGIHAAHNNTLWSGKSILTGHLHSMKITPFTDYNGTRWGVDTGTLADPEGPQFRDYTEDNPKNWRSGFIVLTFVDGELLQPEMVRVMDEGRVDFRGSIIEV